MKELDDFFSCDPKSSSSNYIKYQMTIITYHPINNYNQTKCFMTRTKQLIVHHVPVLTNRISRTKLLLDIRDLTLLQAICSGQGTEKSPYMVCNWGDFIPLSLYEYTLRNRIPMIITAKNFVTHVFR